MTLRVLYYTEVCWLSRKNNQKSCKNVFLLQKDKCPQFGDLCSDGSGCQSFYVVDTYKTIDVVYSFKVKVMLTISEK